MHLSDFVDRLDEELRTEAYAEIDPSANGLQVGRRDRDDPLEHVALAVDAAVETIERAVAADADAMVVHHGLIWGGLERVTGPSYERLAPLFEHDLALYVAHLPLDGHQSLGNAARLADILALESREPFGEEGPEWVGQRGTHPEGLPSERLGDRLEAALDTGGQPVRVLDFGPDPIRDVAIVTGAGADFLEEAAVAGADALVTGEGKAWIYHAAREAGVTIVLAGHYATETVGLEALEELVGQWGLETTFIDAPTGL